MIRVIKRLEAAQPMTRLARATDPSYELMDDHNGLSIIYRQHGFPCPLVRWHFHKEYELHLIVASSGKVFVGDYIGKPRHYSHLIHHRINPVVKVIEITNGPGNTSINATDNRSQP